VHIATNLPWCHKAHHQDSLVGLQETQSLGRLRPSKPTAQGTIQIERDSNSNRAWSIAILGRLLQPGSALPYVAAATMNCSRGPPEQHINWRGLSCMQSASHLPFMKLLCRRSQTVLFVCHVLLCALQEAKQADKAAKQEAARRRRAMRCVKCLDSCGAMCHDC
jgi:hypothetical protein